MFRTEGIRETMSDRQSAMREAGCHLVLVYRLIYNDDVAATGRGPKGCVENGPAAALLVGYV
jgi:hypothetical protein